MDCNGTIIRTDSESLSDATGVMQIPEGPPYGTATNTQHGGSSSARDGSSSSGSTVTGNIQVLERETLTDLSSGSTGGTRSSREAQYQREQEEMRREIHILQHDIIDIRQLLERLTRLVITINEKIQMRPPIEE